MVVSIYFHEEMSDFFKIYSIESVEDWTEYCYYIDSKKNKSDINKVEWDLIVELISHNNIHYISQSSFLERQHEIADIVEFGPNLSVSTPWSSNAMSIIKNSGVNMILKIERSVRTIDRDYFAKNYDRMTQVIYPKPLISFSSEENKLPAYKQTLEYNEPISISIKNIKEYNKLFQLDISDEDLGYYHSVFKNLNRDITTTELVTLAQLNTEHSRHRFFQGQYDVYKLVIDNWDILKLNDNKYSRVISAKYNYQCENESLMDIVRKPYLLNINNSVLAFKDNASAIKGFTLSQLSQTWHNPVLEVREFQPDSEDEFQADIFDFKADIPLRNRKMIAIRRLMHPTLKAETHNFPTGIAPFEGAGTGVGGRIRDTMSIGIGGHMVAGMAGYSVGNLKTQAGSDVENSPIDILLKASDGASDYGNKIGEPIILGFTRSFGETLTCREVVPENEPKRDGGFQRFKVSGKVERKEWLKPIMFSAGIGYVNDEHLDKMCYENLAIVQVGGPAYRIGINGGAVSSKVQSSNDKEINFAAVQRGDPEMESKLVKFINACTYMGPANPIVSIHDQGAGGMANVTSEICENYGAIIHMLDVNKGDDSLSDMETWLAEYQEQVTLLSRQQNIPTLILLAKRENIPLTVVGHIQKEGSLEVMSVVNTETEESKSKFTTLFLEDDDGEGADEMFIKMIDLPIDEIQRNIPRNKYKLIEPYIKWDWNDWCSKYSSNQKTFENITKKILSHINVGSKRFLTSKVDRSVGMVAQQQTIGINQVPLSDYAIVASNYFGIVNHIDAPLTFPGVVTSIGEQPIKGIYDIEKMVRLTVAEMLTNMIWAGIEDFSMIRCAANWMWANNTPNDKFLLHKAVGVLSETLSDLGIAIDGGKDSLSMSVKTQKKTIKAPNTLVLTGYVTTENVTQKVTAGFVNEYNHIIYINLSHKKNRMGGGIMAQVCDGLSGCPNDDIPDFESLDKFPLLFEYIQYHIKAENIVAGHDISDGGLITALIEMTFPNNIGCEIDFTGLGFNNCYKTFMSEEPGLLIEYNSTNCPTNFIKGLNDIGYHQVYNMGHTCGHKVSITYDHVKIMNSHIYELRKEWEEPAHQMEIIQIGEKLATTETTDILVHPLQQSVYFLDDDILDKLFKLELDLKLFEKILLPQCNGLFSPKIAIIREEGSNGDREMKAAFMLAGFQVYDVHMNDLLTEKIKLDTFQGIAFVGGFSYSDTFGAGQGWCSLIKNNLNIKEQFDKFYQREDTFSFGVCNGCQLMSLLGWVPYKSRFIKNDSGRFESRYNVVTVQDTNSIMLQSLRGMHFGIWSAHGEGKYYSEEINNAIDNGDFNSNDHYNEIFPIRYTDYSMNPTEIYPHNPNGSPKGIASIVSENGRHLAMMPHPERSFLIWQLAYAPKEYDDQIANFSPWFLMFRDAYEWCQTKQQEEQSPFAQIYDPCEIETPLIPYDW